MTITIYRNWMRVWEPCREEWQKHSNILRELCVCGSIGFKKKEDILSFFYERGIEACEERDDTEGNTEQLTLF